MSVKKQVQQEINSSKTKTTKAERRKKFSTFKDRLHNMYGPITVYGGTGEAKPVKVMSNEDRRNLGLEEDSALPDYRGINEKKEKKTKKR